MHDIAAEGLSAAETAADLGTSRTPRYGGAGRPGTEFRWR